MKKINSSLCSIFMLFICVFSAQAVFAVDVPLKKGDSSSGNLPQVRSMLSRVTTMSISTNPVFADINGSELGLSFNGSVGIAQVVILDETGSVVYQETVNTNSTKEISIELGGFDSGNYTVQITYSSTKLVGTFQL